MIVEASKLVAAPLMAMAFFLAQLSGPFKVPVWLEAALNVAALAVLFAGFLVLGRLRARADAAEGAAEAWKSERDALELRHERLEEERTEERARFHALEVSLKEEINELKIELAKLEARPTLETLEEEIIKLQALVQASAGVSPPPDVLPAT